MSRTLPTLGSLLQHLLNLLDEDVLNIYRTLELDYRPRFTPVVRFVADHGPASIRSIASETALTHSAASQTVAEMVKHDLARTVAGHNDARERLVHLTPKAEAMLPKLRQCWTETDAVVAELSRSVSCDVEGALRRVLEELDQEPFFARLAARLELPPQHRAPASLRRAVSRGLAPASSKRSGVPPRGSRNHAGAKVSRADVE